MEVAAVSWPQVRVLEPARAEETTAGCNRIVQHRKVATMDKNHQPNVKQLGSGSSCCKSKYRVQSENKKAQKIKQNKIATQERKALVTNVS